MGEYIKENLTTECLGSYDIAVCGGGFAGISASLSAVREGKKVILIEKQYMLGGLGTAGLVTIYLPLCDGLGRQVSFGIAEELFRLSIKHGAEGKEPTNWLNEGSRTEKDARFEVQYNPQMFAILAEKLLLSEGVTILYGTTVVRAEKEGDKITHLVVENKTGRGAYRVSSVVDCTGDCDIAKMSGAPTELFKQGNVLAAWYYFVNSSGYQLKMHGFSDIPDDEKTEQNKVAQLVNKRFLGVSAEELSEMTILSHNEIYKDILKSGEKKFLATVATTPQIRMTRKIKGEYTQDIAEMHKYFPDSIGMVSDWRKRGPVYEVPFRTLYSSAVKNLIVAGRCTSVSDSLWDVMRVIPCCAVTGQAAGIASSMTDDFTSIDIKTLQDKLQKSGVVLHESDL